MTLYRLQSAYLPQGWARDVRVTVSDGMITAIETSAPAGPHSTGPHSTEPHSAEPYPTAPQPAPAEEIERVDGIVVPGMPNAHSHAFQRALAGNTEYRSSARDSFWTWRRAMYALANRVEPDDLQTLATQLFIEMLKSGYTSVAEFHYLHRKRDGTPYTGTNELWEAIASAATAAG